MKSVQDIWLELAVLLVLVLQSCDSGWSPWGQFTACTQPCGGGVKYRDRLCVVDRSRSECVGKKRVYRLCNTQECEQPRDVRASQCDEYNSQPLDGSLYTWKPYTAYGETCELLCYAEGTEFYHKLSDHVIDGTPCGTDKHRICIEGKCRSIGCDMKIGSSHVRDTCGVCGGDNSTCSQLEEVSGRFETVKLPPGYTTMVELPVGATDIYVRELGENKNSLAFWDSSGDNFGIDKDTRQTLPTIGLAGAMFIYTPLDQYNTHGEIQSKGPLHRQITVYVVNEGSDNPGIQYGYKLPTYNGGRRLPDNSAIHNKPLKSVHDTENTPHIALKINSNELETENIRLPDSGLQAPSIIRVKTKHEQSPISVHGAAAISRVLVVDNSDTSSGGWNTQGKHINTKKEPSEQFVYQNNVQVLGGVTSIRDNSQGKPNRDSNSVLAATAETESRVFAAQQREVPPAELSYANLADNGHRYMWSHGHWTPCSNNCGKGFQRRVVSCIDREQRITTDSKYCDLDHRPDTSRSCQNKDCIADAPQGDYVRWQSGSWSPCSRSCDLGDQTKDVYCESVRADDSAIQVDDELCLEQYKAKPQYRRSCNDGVSCTPPTQMTLQTMWSIAAWGQCSVTCGEGRQERSVVCRYKTNQRHVLSEEACNSDLKPTTVRRCSPTPCFQRPPATARPIRRRSCTRSQYGCCPDGVTSARGARGFGCPVTTPRPRRSCRTSTYGCCPDGVTYARGIRNGGCVVTTPRPIRQSCRTSTYGCCPDGVTYARGIRNGGCVLTTPRPIRQSCRTSTYGCCPDGVTYARGIRNGGCVITTPRPFRQSCRTSTYGCCPDGVTYARGVRNLGCPTTTPRPRPARHTCRTSRYGCCPDGVTKARGARGRGCRTKPVHELRAMVTLNCDVQYPGGRPDSYVVQWRKDGLERPVLIQYSGHKANTHADYSGRVRLAQDRQSLEVHYIQPSDQGWYECMIADVDDTTQRRTARTYLDNNIHITEDDSKPKAEPTNRNTATCQLPKSQGTCRDFKVKWFYNNQNNDEGKPEGCQRFWYGDCGGNANRFDNESDCRAACQTEDVCRMPSVTGNCRARHMRWYFNHERKECLQFIYGGCDGNGNRFKTQADCQRQCLHGNAPLGDEERDCKRARFGCCHDQVTVARGNNYEGCPNTCSQTLYGCCDDDITAAQGPNQEGCEVIEISSGDGSCDVTEFGCCRDGVTAAQGPGYSGCLVVDPVPETTIVPAQCRFPSEMGPCRSHVAMWYYNTTVQRCTRFWYGGCQGNSNRFKNEKECLHTCQRRVVRPTEPETPRVPVCQQPKEIGPCRGAMPKFFYNSATGACEQFLYGGCQGNNNNFDTQAVCEQYCVRRTEPPVSKGGSCPSVFARDDSCQSNCRSDGDCPGTQKCCSDATRCSKCYDIVEEETGIEISKPGSCAHQFVFDYSCRSTCLYDSECPGTQKCCSDATKCSKCHDIVEEEVEIVLTPKEVCAQPAVVGRCRAAIPRYFYNPNTKACEQFTYGGCDGNRNNFETMETCERYCRPNVPNPEPRKRLPVCEMTPALGPCRRSQSKYFYNITSMQCETFTYGGCLGNHNNFQTEVKCNSYCGLRQGSSRSDNCDLPKEVGGCRGNFRRWYYAADVGRCFEFGYGGCQGNGNNFESEERCLSACRDSRPVDPVNPRTRPPVIQPDEDICSLPLVTPCDTPRAGSSWYYDSLIGQCTEIPNQECNKNRNNFGSREECARYCSRERVCQPLTYSTEIRCYALIPRWTYSRDSGRCESFSYGGCGGSANNFDSEESCQQKCRPRVTPVTVRPVDEDICSLPLVTPCDTPRAGSSWYYDSLIGQCTEIPNQECNKNRNNFGSREECARYCSRERVCQPLTYSTEIRCLALIPRWTYSRDSGRCESFSYGGCGGSANNFDSEESCQQKCRPHVRPVTVAPVTLTNGEICGQPEDPGNCLAYIRNWRYDTLTGVCVEFTYGGCGGNKNNFDTRESCERFCSRAVVCQAFEEPEISCLAYIPRWRYDPQSRQCENFIYGGCQGNANNFETFETCERKCIPQTTAAPDRGGNEVENNRASSWTEICRLQADVGPCKQYIRKWHYNSISQSCEEFTYGGCLGNHNNFESKVQCMTYCDHTRFRPEERTTTEEPDIEIESSGELPTAEPETGVDVCALESRTGRCRAYVRSWFYNASAGQCDQFVYGGCDGNANNFASQDECDRHCSPREVCLLPQQSGSCLAYIPRYYFDYGAQECREFVYGGCESNANNFYTKEACLGRCGSLIRTEPPDNKTITTEETNINTTEITTPKVESKTGTCPAMRHSDNNGSCLEQCRMDSHCPGTKKCCVIACSLVCIDPTDTSSPTGPKVGECPPRPDRGGLLGACAPTCRDDDSCPGNQKCCYKGCGLQCVDPTVTRPTNKAGYCPARTDKQGLLGACQPECQDDSSCQGDQKCCYYGCGLRCIYPVDEEPYSMDAPARLSAVTLSENEIMLRWSDPSLGREQTIRDGRYYTVRHYSYSIGQYEYNNVTDMRARINGLKSDTDYEFQVRSNLPPYLSEWSEPSRNRTDVLRVVTKYGQCPVLTNGLGICVENCANDGECAGDQKCCSNGCGHVCMNPAGPTGDVCSMPKDAGSCGDWTERWYFSTDSERPGCQFFWYGGCNQGNGNNFADKETCQATCQGIRPVTTTQRPYYDCRRSMYGCCADRYTTQLDSEGSNCEENRQKETVVPATPGESVTLTCRYGDNVTWYREGKLVQSGGQYTVNSDGTLLVLATDIDDDGMYACHYDNGGRVTIYRYHLQVRVPIGILPGPDVIMVKPNHMAFLHCEVYGNPKPLVTWTKGGASIDGVSGYNAFSNGTLLIQRTTEADKDDFTCRADNGVSEPVYRTLKLSLKESLEINLENNNGRVPEGSRITLSCEGRGYPTPTVTWEKSGRGLTSGGTVYISSSGQLVIRNATLDDTGMYTCIVANTEDKVESSTSVQVIPRTVVDERCEDKTSLYKCRLIITANLCRYSMYSKICCKSCVEYFNDQRHNN